MKTVWIDLDNAPHVLFFSPIIRHLEGGGHRVVVTVRDFGYTEVLARQAGLDITRVGRHPGANKALKALAIAHRAVRLAGWTRGRGVDVAVSHGSRGLAVGAYLARIPSLILFDYEFVSTGLFSGLSTRLLLPDALRDTAVGRTSTSEVRFYPGLKEEVYLGAGEPRLDLRTELGIPEDRVVALLRPPATSAHYHHRDSEGIFRIVLDRVASDASAFGVVAPRTAEQARRVADQLPDRASFRILEEPADGPSLILASDLVVGGGGTMNREAAALGVPVYSIFSGPVGAIDRQLAEDGRLTPGARPRRCGRHRAPAHRPIRPGRAAWRRFEPGAGPSPSASRPRSSTWPPADRSRSCLQFCA